MTQPVPGAGITILGIASAADKMRHFRLLIQNVFQKWVWTHVGCFNLEKVFDLFSLSAHSYSVLRYPPFGSLPFDFDIVH
jgi:hypothetical protein